MNRPPSEAFALRLAVLVIAATSTLLAHKPVTSKFNYNEHVFRIVRDRCGSCHVEGGVAPMSLMTYADAYPWAESIRAELIAGHMPPSQVDDAFVPVKRPAPLTPRELDMIVTWATGGAPEGPVSAKPQPIGLRREWPLGTPDLSLELPDTVTIRAGEMQATREFAIDAGAVRGARLRALDLLPGTPAIVRRATFDARHRGAADARTARTLDTWLPGGNTIAAPDDACFVIRTDETLVVTVEYRKTWKYENQAVSDRSRIGLYFARPDATHEIKRVPLDAAASRLEHDTDAVAVQIAATEPDVDVVVRAIRPDGSPLQLIAAAAAPGWPRRFWFVRPVHLPADTRLEVTAAGQRSATAVLDVVAR